MGTLMALGLSVALAAPAAAPRRPSPAVPAAAPAAAEAQAVLDEIARRGARPVLEELYAREARWRPVIAGVASGHPRWLEVAARFKRAAMRNLAVSQELTVAVARALEQAPAAALGVLEGAFDADDVCSLNTLEDSLGTDYAAARGTVERRERAVSKVTNPSLGPRRDTCLEFLRELKGELVRNREAWFPAR
ncbi:MAG TPA: hypothetical protein VMT87_03725 [Vicinamibacteria bacterium]|nr:hypothetical protein [Vicinamibacteria bacterium]